MTKILLINSSHSTCIFFVLGKNSGYGFENNPNLLFALAKIEKKESSFGGELIFPLKIKIISDSSFLWYYKCILIK